MIFGVYGGGVAGTDTGIATGPADEPDLINQALDQLQGRAEDFLVRAYVHFSGPGGSKEELRTPGFMADYARNGRKLDLVLCDRDAGGDLGAWIEFILGEIGRFGPALGKLQITEEPNLYRFPGDGEFFPPGTLFRLAERPGRSWGGVGDTLFFMALRRKRREERKSRKSRGHCLSWLLSFMALRRGPGADGMRGGRERDTLFRVSSRTRFPHGVGRIGSELGTLVSGTALPRVGRAVA